MKEGSSKGIKNPFGDSDEMSPMNSSSMAQNLRSPSEQEDYVRNELAKSGITEDTLKFGINMGKQMVKNSRCIDFFSLDGLKPYFDVDNKYVLTKLKKIFVPFLKDKTQANINANDSMQQIPQNNDRFDLYLPMMSFITYVLVIAFNIAFSNAQIFGPQILGKILTKDFSLYMINAMILKLIMFIFLKSSLSFLDIVALVGYKFIPLTLFIEGIILMYFSKFKHIIFGIISIFSILYVRRCLNMKLPNENFKKAAIYIAFALEILTLFILILDIPYYIQPVYSEPIISTPPIVVPSPAHRTVEASPTPSPIINSTTAMPEN